MRIRRTVPMLLAAALAAGALAFAPAVTTAESDGSTTQETDDPGTPLLAPCTDRAEGTTVVTPDSPFDDTVPTPVGTFGSARADAGLYQVDLAGLPEGTVAQVRMTLSWDTPGGLGDYDLVVSGQNDLSTDSPEVHERTLPHCSYVNLQTEVFLGTPFDTVSLVVEVAATD